MTGIGLDILTVAFVIFCIITQLQWLEVYRNGARKTEKLFLISLLVMLGLAVANLSKDIFEYETTLVQRSIFFMWSLIMCYYYRGKTFK